MVSTTEQAIPHAEIEPERLDSKDLGLAAGLLIGRVLFETDELHFGYWDQGLEVKLANLPAAQERYSEFLLSNIPEGVKTILDVGCGAGKFAERLIAAGYEVEAVCPSPLLVSEAQKRLGADVRINLMPFDEFETDKQYDLVLFSESFQYVDMADALPRAARYAKPGGHLMICDFFQKGTPGRRYIRGGAKLKQFEPLIEASPFENIVDLDITEQTSPTQDIANDVIVRLGGPLVGLIRSSLRQRHPWIAKIAEWRLKKKLEKMERKYFSGMRSGDHFREFLSYRLLVYKKPS